jgi:hypothetical protein
VISHSVVHGQLSASKIAGGISMGLNSLRHESTVAFILSHVTLLIQARIKQYAARLFSPAFIPYPGKWNSCPHMLEF